MFRNRDWTFDLTKIPLTGLPDNSNITQIQIFSLRSKGLLISLKLVHHQSFALQKSSKLNRKVIKKVNKISCKAGASQSSTRLSTTSFRDNKLKHVSPTTHNRVILPSPIPNPLNLNTHICLKMNKKRTTNTVTQTKHPCSNKKLL